MHFAISNFAYIMLSEDFKVISFLAAAFAKWGFCSKTASSHCQNFWQAPLSRETQLIEDGRLVTIRAGRCVVCPYKDKRCGKWCVVYSCYPPPFQMQPRDGFGKKEQRHRLDTCNFGRVHAHGWLWPISLHPRQLLSSFPTFYADD